MKEKKINLFITGGSGFIGNKLIDFLLKDPNLYLKVHVNNSKIKNFSKDRNIEFVTGNLSDFKNLTNFNKDTEFFINLAFDKSNLKKNIKIAKNIVKVINSQTNLNLLHISTADVYDGQKGIINDSKIPKPISKYSKVKYQIEEILNAEKNKKQIKILRISEVFGNNGHGINSHINRCLKWQIWQIKLFIFFKKNKYMSYIASNDLVRIIKYAVYHFEEIKNISLITDDRGNRNNYSLFYKKIQDFLNGSNFKSNKKFLNVSSQNKYVCSSKFLSPLNDDDSYWYEVSEACQFLSNKKN